MHEDRALSPTQIVLRFGAEWAPDSPYGLDVLELGADGRFRYENRWQGEVRTCAGRLEPAAWDAVVHSLRRAGFPEVFPHALLPGASLVEIVARTPHGEDAARMCYFAALKEPGYGPLVRQLSEWSKQLRAHARERP